MPLVLCLAINEAFITLKANLLTPGEKYTLSVNMTSNEKDSTLAVWSILVNHPPYNGTCVTDPKSGIFQYVRFTVTQDNI